MSKCTSSLNLLLLQQINVQLFILGYSRKEGLTIVENTETDYFLHGSIHTKVCE